jgi:hypothetical protein
MYKSLNYLYFILFAYTFGIQNVSIDIMQLLILFIKQPQHSIFHLTNNILISHLYFYTFLMYPHVSKMYPKWIHGFFKKV